jgi:glycerol-3-phosphate O-acyltransferase/dihydroxyacetone phosphate acyltransferase
MWLLPAFATLSRLISATYFNLAIEGRGVPSTGPVLIVANHPNSLLDPVIVAAAAGRPVRFLAKSGLFSVPVIKYLIRGAGAIPVYRKQDDPALMARNEDTFSAAYTALAEGSAVGIFPEGISHDEPGIVQLKTGAARVALGAAQIGGALPIVPVGLVFRQKDVFRSQALVVIGDSIGWDDLAMDGPEPESVLALTGRIEEALRSVTINLDRWEDAPLVEAADAIWVAELGGGRTPSATVGRIREGARRLAELRRGGDTRWVALSRDVLRHARQLKQIGLTPSDLTQLDARAGALGIPALLPVTSAIVMMVWAVGVLLFWLPYRLVGIGDTMLKPETNVRSTTKVLAGGVVFAVWIILLGIGVSFVSGVGWGVVALLLLPLLAVLTLRVQQEWDADKREWRRLILSRTRRGRFVELQRRQKKLAEEMAALLNPSGFVSD